MLKSSARTLIRLRGVRHNNLKNFDLDLPANQLIVVTGLSGSGKSSLAFDTLFAEGQRRYIETFSPYARQFFDRMDKPQVDSIEGIPPAIAIEQRNAVRTTRSTVGTMTEICDYMKMLWPHLAQLHCRECGQPVRKEAPQHIWEALLLDYPADGSKELLITFDLPLTEKLSFEDSLALVARQGYQRLLFSGQIHRLEDLVSEAKEKARRIVSLTVIQDRLRFTAQSRARFVEACEQAYHFGKGKLAIRELSSASVPLNPRLFSKGRHCARCDLEYREPLPALFSFNHPVGACPKCKGFGRVISIDYKLALPDPTRTLEQGVVKPWQTGQGLECHSDLMRMCRHFEIPTDVPFQDLPAKWQEFVINGDPDYGKDDEHEWPRVWYGIKGYFRWLESRAYKMHVRVLLSRYRAYTPCPDCQGKRLQPEALLYRVGLDERKMRPAAKKQDTGEEGVESPPSARWRRNGRDTLNLAELYQLPIRDALHFIERLGETHRPGPKDPLGLVLDEVRSRLGYLQEVGLGYITLDRPTRSLSGGETERVNLTTCLGARLVNTLFVLDEPSVGLHPRDTERLVRILEKLRDAGNTVVVVEHEASVMRAADQIVDLGPGHGASGGEVVFQGTYAEILRSQASLTGRYLSGLERIEIPSRRAVGEGKARFTEPNGTARGAIVEPVALREASVPFGNRPAATPWLVLSSVNRHNLKNLTVEIPLGRLVCVTGVSGSGKSTLIREVLHPAVTAKLGRGGVVSKASDRLSTDSNGDEEENGGDPESSGAAAIRGAEHLARVVFVDQSILGKTPRSNPALYVGAFDGIRELFAQSDLARQRGLNASAFSFNSGQGRCERCGGAGFEKIEMQFLSDVFIRCPDCDGRRYRAHILEVKLAPRAVGSRAGAGQVKEWSIGDMLEATVDEALEFLGGFPGLPPAESATASLRLLRDVGLGYLKLGQPINTLSGGESQRLKLVRHLAEANIDGSSIAAVDNEDSRSGAQGSRRGTMPGLPVLFLFDEPTTGLHFDDVRVLLEVFQALVAAGHSVMVIEHNLDVIKSADWIIDLGPGAGDEGGHVVAVGTPEQVAGCARSHTGQALQTVLGHSTKTRASVLQTVR